MCSLMQAYSMWALLDKLPPFCKLLARCTCVTEAYARWRLVGVLHSTGSTGWRGAKSHQNTYELNYDQSDSRDFEQEYMALRIIGGASHGLLLLFSLLARTVAVSSGRSRVKLRQERSNIDVRK